MLAMRTLPWYVIHKSCIRSLALKQYTQDVQNISTLFRTQGRDNVLHISGGLGGRVVGNSASVEEYFMGRS